MGIDLSKLSPALQEMVKGKAVNGIVQEGDLVNLGPISPELQAEIDGLLNGNVLYGQFDSFGPTQPQLVAENKDNDKEGRFAKYMDEQYPNSKKSFTENNLLEKGLKILGVGLAATLGIFSSCTNEFNVSQSVQINLSEFQQAVEKNNSEEIMKFLKEAFEKQDAMWNERWALLIKVLQDNGKKWDEIIDLLISTNQSNEMILDAILIQNEDTRNALSAILNAVESNGGKLDSLNETNKDMLNKILDAIKKLPKDDDSAILAALNNILGKLTIAIEDGKVADDATQAQLDVIIGLISAGNEIANQILGAINGINAKLDKITDKQKDLFNAILAKLDGMDKNAMDGVAKLLDAINNNTLVDENILATLKAFVDKFDKFNAETQKALGTLFSAVSEGNAINKEILAKLEGFAKNYENMTAEQKAFYDATIIGIANILEKIGNINPDNGDVNVNFDTAKMEKLLETLVGQMDMLMAKVDKMDKNQQDAAKEILAKLGDMDANQAEFALALLNKLDAMSKDGVECVKKIINAIDNNTQIDKEILAKLTEFTNKYDNMTAEQKAFYDATIIGIANILEKIGNINPGSGDVNVNFDTEKMEALLGTLVDQMEKVLKNQSTMDANQQAFAKAVLAKLDQMDANAMDGVAKLLDAINNNTLVDKDILATLKAFVDKFDKFNAETQKALGTLFSAVSEGNAISKEILAKLEEFAQNYEKMTADQKDFYNKVLKKIGEINIPDGNGNVVVDNSKIEALLTEILGKMNDLLAKDNGDNDLKPLIEALIEKVDTSNEQNKAYFEAALGSMKAILEKLDVLGDDLNTVIDVVSKLGANEPVDLSTIENALAELLNVSKENGDKLDGINDNLDTLKVLIKGLADKLDKNQKELVGWLEDIYNKIPAGCKCDPDKLVIILEKILTAVESGKSDESVKGDLEDILG